MKQEEIEEIIKERFKTLYKLSHKIIQEFNADDIHEFRIEVKKLRAFLRLLDEEKEMNKPLIPSLLKTFYGYIGIIRNIQLHRHSLFKYVTDFAIAEPEAYIKVLDDEKNYWQKQAISLMADNSFNDDEVEILKHVPAKLEKAAIKKFIKKKLAELKEQLKDLKDDNAIHTVRKILKDILYNWKYIPHDDLPKAISEKENLKQLTTLLGDFRDECIQLEFLSNEYLSKIHDTEEKIILQQMKEQFLREKKIIQQQLTYSFNKLREQL